MRTNTLAVLALILATAGSVFAQSGTERRAAEARQRLEAELRAAREARTAGMAEARAEMEAALQVLKAQEADLAERRMVELQQALETARRHGEVDEERLTEIRAALEETRAGHSEAIEARRAEMEAALQAARAQHAELAAAEREQLEVALAQEAEAMLQQRRELQAAREAQRDLRADQRERQAREVARIDRLREIEHERQRLEERLREEREVARDERARVAERLRDVEADRLDRVREERELERQRALLERAAVADADLDRWLDRVGAEGPREGWAPQDPAHGLWRQARARLNGGDYDAAIELFRQIRSESRFAESEYRPDAYYWEAFALARKGGSESLQEARKVLQELQEAYPPDRRSPDAEALAARIDAQLAGRGLPEANPEVAERLRSLARARPLERDAERAVLEEARALQQYETARAAAGSAAYSNLLRDQSQQYAAAAYAGQLASALRAENLAFAAQASRQCQNDEEEIRLIALNALVEMDDTAALPALRDVLARRDACAPQFRRQAMMILTRRDSPGTESIALQAAREDPDPEVRLLALTWLIEKENAEAFDIAQSVLDSEADPDVRRAAIMALAHSRNQRAQDILRAFVRSDAPVEQRGQALMALPRGARDSQFLRQLYGESADRQLKEYALMALGRRALEGEADWLLGIARDEGEEVDLRVQALWMLRAESAPALNVITGIFDQSEDRRLREAAMMMIMERSRDDPAALAKIIAIAQEEEDADFRKQAVMTLVRSQDPRAEAVLLEILRKK